MSEVDPFLRKKFNVQKTVMLTAFICSVVTILVVILACVFMSVMYPEASLPSFLETAGTAALGAVLGTFPLMVRDFLE